jgi:hypothetical protein
MRETFTGKFPHISKLRMAAWVAFLVLSTAAMMAQSTPPTGSSATQPSAHQGAAMKQFVLIFRQGTARQVSPEEQAKRFAEIRAWARKWIGEGYSFDPRQLGQETYRIAPDGDSDSAGERTIVNLLFLTAKDFDDAVKIARTHPGVGYGTHIEVRDWTAPGPPVAPAR